MDKADKTVSSLCQWIRLIMNVGKLCEWIRLIKIVSNLCQWTMWTVMIININYKYISVDYVHKTENYVILFQQITTMKDQRKYYSQCKYTMI